MSASNILDRLTNRIANGVVDPVPTDNIFVEDLFAPDIYQKMLASLPPDDAYDQLDHPDARRADGTSTRLALDLTPNSRHRFPADTQDFWGMMMTDVFASSGLQKALLDKYRTTLDQRFGDQYPEITTVPLFLRDFPGYHISIHPDTGYKLVTFQLYLPADETQIHLGTSYHIREDKEFRLHKTNPFKPNSAHSFVRTDESWHSVAKMGPHEKARNSLAIILYMKGHEYKASERYT